MNRVIIILVLMVFAQSVHAGKRAINQSIADHVKADLDLVQSLHEFEQGLAPTFLAVGGDADQNWCNHSTLQAAIDDAKQQGITSIRVAYNKTYVENLLIEDMSISIVGGYASCQAARAPFSSPNSNQVSINGGGNASVMELRGFSQRHTILLKNLRLFNGVGTKIYENLNGLRGGGIVIDELNAKLSLNNVDVRDNTATYGGGISVNRGKDTDLILLNSRVLFNTAEEWGGGIQCFGSGISIVLAQNSGINVNEAKYGGGVYLNGCYFGLYSGTAEGGLVGISSNRAGGNGGGVSASYGYIVALNGQMYCPASGPCLGDDTNPVSIRGNIAGLDGGNPKLSNGGGIHASSQSTVLINAGFIEGNSALNGGGIAIVASNLTVKREGKACWDNQRCNLFLGNWSEESGGAIYLNGGNVDISASFFEQNLANQGDVLFSLVEEYNGSTSPSFARIEGSVFDHNGNSTSTSIFRIEAESSLDIVHSTIADNTTSNVYGAAIFNSIYDSGDAPSLEIYSSILDNPGRENLYHNMVTHTASFSCIITNDPNSLTDDNNIINPVEDLAGGARILNTIAGFADRNNRNYKLVAGSAAIDYCHTPTYAEVNFRDIEFQERGKDDPDRADNYFLSFYDIGADEAYVGPTIFKDSFE